jgi:hypothetical protein
MRRPVTNLILISCGLWSCAFAAEDSASKCPRASKALQNSCREVTREDLPAEAIALLRKLKCEVAPGSNYDYGSAVDLNGDGVPEYEVCCHESPHGPCSAVVIGRLAGEWKDLTAKEGLLGYDGACNLFVILEDRHNGFHDVCLPDECAPGTGSPETPCVPTLWRYTGDRYEASKPAR